ncbi:RNA polymerase sigma factor [Ktedonobacter robiniae]|uniref:RNA polymerase sigma24 factor n=1 Tax=Ktedonobacter robiniae TaxID=2778365 RepID=A0ABQ3UKD4_9CHLR|nr:RNA polymerase sigma factor [Ktedonobacter robiniae]GHO53146.1 RNA polymerase sigma24 factor [Ktedonobacter robiniae]
MQPLRSLDDEDEVGISELYRQHASALLPHLRANLKSREDAEDLLLEVFIAALERDSLRTLSQEEQRSWLWRVARNKLVDHYRRRARQQNLPLEVASDMVSPDGEFIPEWTMLRNEEQHDLITAIEGLPSLQKEVLLLRYVEGLRSPEIARMLGKRDTAVRMILSRTLNLLRQTFEKRLGGK